MAKKKCEKNKRNWSSQLPCMDPLAARTPAIFQLSGVHSVDDTIFERFFSPSKHFKCWFRQMPNSTNGPISTSKLSPILLLLPPLPVYSEMLKNFSDLKIFNEIFDRYEMTISRGATSKCFHRSVKSRSSWACLLRHIHSDIWRAYSFCLYIYWLKFSCLYTHTYAYCGKCRFSSLLRTEKPSYPYLAQWQRWHTLPSQKMVWDKCTIAVAYPYRYLNIDRRCDARCSKHLWAQVLKNNAE